VRKQNAFLREPMRAAKGFEIKILYWERNGFCLRHKCLEQEKFRWP